MLPESDARRERVMVLMPRVRMILLKRQKG
nr:MAG TPA: hypothetical protein [Caudoviricetes sp.]